MKSNDANPVRFGREICGQLDQAERREWWLANGRGAYAAGTVAGTLTRRYHGLLVAPVNPPLGRFLVFAKADATLIDDDQSWPLFTNRWAGDVVDPRGFTDIESFELEGRMPVWRFARGDIAVEQRIWMEPGADTTYVAYKLVAGGEAIRPLRLRVKLLANARDHHGSTGAGGLHPQVHGDGIQLRVEYPNWFDFHIKVRGGTVAPEGYWMENFDLPAERDRGLPDRDNHLCVGHAELELRAGEWVGVVGSLKADASPYLEEALRRYRASESDLLVRARAMSSELAGAPAWIDQLILAADSFVFARPLPDLPEGESVIAGYPWFGDWGRDTMIALTGLTLPTGRYASARRILETFARFVDRGMLPNYFPGAGEAAEYNTVDAALWFVEAWRAYFEVTQDVASLRNAYPVLAGIVESYRTGTRYSIRLDERDGLLHAGEPGVQLTWMDAKVGDHVITPRIGKPVEINALWYNALACLIQFAERLDQPAEPLRVLAARAREGFKRFVKPDGGGLYDVLDGPDGTDAKVRPNQIFAVSLPASPLDAVTQADVVRVCGRELLSSYGLRSLSPREAEFRPHYRGDVWERDSGYHQGPVWGWLLGHYALAEYRVTGDIDAAQRRLEPIRDHLNDGALGTISEIFDGAAPHHPSGAPAQVWSVACTLEAWWRLERAKNRVAGEHRSTDQPADPRGDDPADRRGDPPANLHGDRPSDRTSELQSA